MAGFTFLGVQLYRPVSQELARRRMSGRGICIEGKKETKESGQC